VLFGDEVPNPLPFAPADLKQVSVSNKVISLSNQSSGGYGSGIDIDGVTYSVFNNNIVLGENPSPKQTHGIYEQGTSDYNIISSNQIVNTSSGVLVGVVGTHTCLRSAGANGSGFGTSSPNNTVDIAGGLSVRDQVLTLSNGDNNNIALPAGAGTLYTAGPSAGYAITGIAGGHSGRKITIVNYVGQTLTIKYNSGSSDAGKKILIGGSADLAIPVFGSVQLVFVAGANAWIVEGYKV